MLISLVNLLLVFSVLLCIDIYRSNCTVNTIRYQIESKEITTPLKIVQVSDLHTKDFGENNAELYSAIEAEKPNLLLLTGDIVDRHDNNETQVEFLKKTVSALSEIAPVYYCIGNHERASIDTEILREVISENGGVLLDGEYRDINANGSNIRIGGLSYYRFWDEESNAFLKDFESTQDFTLLLCHHPEFFEWGVNDYKIDLTLSGHTHAGLIRLPLVGALYAPEQGFLPEYDEGLFEEENGTLIVSSGLAASPRFLPRVLNPCELTVIEIT